MSKKKIVLEEAGPDNKFKEVVEFAAVQGKQTAADAFGVTLETINRYFRKYKKEFGEIDDKLGRIKEKFSDQELEILLRMDKNIKNAHTVYYDFSGEIVTFLAFSDTHYGSSYSVPARTHAMFAEARKEGCDFAVHAGDVTEGIMGRPNSVFECTHYGYNKQRDHAVDMLKEWEKPIYMINGNHDMSMDIKLGAGCNMVEDICDRLPNAIFVGDGLGTIELPKQKIKIGLFHGADAGSSYALSYRLQRIINNMNPSQKPHVLVSGHDHKGFYMPYRNIHAVAGGCLQRQTGFMAQKGLIAMEGFWIIKMAINSGEVKWFQQRWYPFYV